jgi:hypothetical protein
MSRLEPTIFDVRNTSIDKSASILLHISKYSSRHSRFLTAHEMVLVWQYSLVMNKSTLFMRDSYNNFDSHAIDGPRSVLALTPRRHIECTQNVFFYY